jgi:hypothetical protein
MQAQFTSGHERAFQDTLSHGTEVRALTVSIHHHAPDRCAQELGRIKLTTHGRVGHTDGSPAGQVPEGKGTLLVGQHKASTGLTRLLGLIDVASQGSEELSVQGLRRGVRGVGFSCGTALGGGTDGIAKG